MLETLDHLILDQ